MMILGGGDDPAAPHRLQAHRRRGAWTTVAPVPAGAPPPPQSHPTLGNPTARWCYTDTTGAVLGYVLRFDATTGDKVFRPVTYARPSAGGPPAWQWESWPPKRPLY